MRIEHPEGAQEKASTWWNKEKGRSPLKWTPSPFLGPFTDALFPVNQWEPVHKRIVEWGGSATG